MLISVHSQLWLDAKLARKLFALLEFRRTTEKTCQPLISPLGSGILKCSLILVYLMPTRRTEGYGSPLLPVPFSLWAP